MAPPFCPNQALHIIHSSSLPTSYSLVIKSHQFYLIFNSYTLYLSHFYQLPFLVHFLSRPQQLLSCPALTHPSGLHYSGSSSHSCKTLRGLLSVLLQHPVLIHFISRVSSPTEQQALFFSFTLVSLVPSPDLTHSRCSITL